MKTAIHRTLLILGVSLSACASMAQTAQNVPSAHFTFTAGDGTPVHKDHAQLISVADNFIF
ncbi:hypothetical protein ACFP9V_25005 [Deinococcus radiopugnans]|uniref:ABC-type Fe3+-hydroxamate transport system substrate-binding protein n=1 Tax=Deinococcus radiopugnans ATCC 19172 TaxID=585398 RepID=A0A5C4XXF6_9DEIO|nr:hypothetical protein [Deinococcus radiopugnans]MBB6018531.1 ABC-type Fe3+-hydroxamate transport system substrate-binding protein [Deinococcus radiopugnans ATCC 19172]TNM67385.1 hypothetical protein FHR04_18315 [Deinococcus radiopugnans ATCC 19172]